LATTTTTAAAAAGHSRIKIIASDLLSLPLFPPGRCSPFRFLEVSIDLFCSRLPGFRGFLNAGPKIIISARSNFFGGLRFDHVRSATGGPTSSAGRGTGALIGHSHNPVKIPDGLFTAALRTRGGLLKNKIGIGKIAPSQISDR